MIRKIWALVLALLATCAPALAASYTSSQNGDWNLASTWGAAGVPGDGDTATIAAGHTVTVSDARTVGVSGATGTVALTIGGSGSSTHGKLLIISGGRLNARGDVNLQKSSIWECDSGGAFVFDPPAGSTYKVNVVAAGGTGDATLTVSGLAGNMCAISTSVRGGGNGFFDGTTVSNSLVVNISYGTFTSCGTASQKCIDVTGTATEAFQIAHSLFVSSGTVSMASSSAGMVFSIDTTDFRSPVSAAFKCNNSAAKTAGTRSVTNVTIYSGGSPQPWCTDLQIGNAGTQTVGIIGYRIGPDLSVNGARSHWEFSAILDDTAISPMMTALGNGSQIFDATLMWSHYSNPHVFGEAGNGALTANIYRNGICDGDGFYSGDAGDYVLPTRAATINHNLLVNSCGTLITGLNANGNGTVTNNTLYNNFGVTLGETTGAATQMTVFRNNLIVKPNATQFCDGVHQGGAAFVKQSSLSLDYNGFYQLGGSGDSGASACGSGIRHPALNTPSYLAIGAKQVVAASTATAGTNTTTLVCSTCNFSAAGVLAGDGIYNSTRTGYASIQSVDSATQVTLQSAISGQVSGDSFTVRSSYWATASQFYGDNDRGQHDMHVNPGFRDVTRTLAGWDTGHGGTGTIASAAAQMVKLNGYDSSGAATVFNSNYTVANALAYLRYGFTPTNPALKGAGSPADGSPDIGALPAAAGPRRASVTWR